VKSPVQIWHGVPEEGEIMQFTCPAGHEDVLLIQDIGKKEFIRIKEYDAESNVIVGTLYTDASVILDATYFQCQECGELFPLPVKLEMASLALEEVDAKDNL
jgi:hypothetical protein